MAPNVQATHPSACRETDFHQTTWRTRNEEFMASRSAGEDLSLVERFPTKSRTFTRRPVRRSAAQAEAYFAQAGFLRGLRPFIKC